MNNKGTLKQYLCCQNVYNGGDLEVREPLWRRKEIEGKMNRMWNSYKNDE